MKELSGLRRGDAAVVGGGLTGLLLASSLAQAGMRVIVLDTGESRMPHCTCAGTVLCSPAYQRIRDIHGLDAARMYAASLMGHLSDILAVPQPYVQNADVSLYARTVDELPRLCAQQELLQQLGIPSSAAADSCCLPAEATLTAPNQVLVDMLQWQQALMCNIRRCGGQVYACTAITDLHSRKVCTARGCTEAPLIVFAGIMPPFAQGLSHPYLLERRLLILRELHGIFPLHSIQLPVDADGVSLYPAPSGAIASWDAGRCGTRRQQERRRTFDAALSNRLPDWQQASTQYLYEIFSADGLPIIGNLPGSRHLFAAGTGGTGILGAMHAAAVLNRRILGQIHPEDQLYAPDRPLSRWFIPKEQRRLRTIRLQGMLRRTAPSCSHCGCRMRYCTALSHWACPLCGSVFNMLGQVICGPAMHEAQLSARQRPVW